MVAQGFDACARTSEEAKRSCLEGAQSNYVNALGKCANVSDPLARQACQDQAQADLNAALAPDAARWVQGRARVELAKLAIGRGDRDGAIRESRAAIDLCGQAHDPLCLDEAKKVVR